MKPISAKGSGTVRGWRLRQVEPGIVELQEGRTVAIVHYGETERGIHIQEVCVRSYGEGIDGATLRQLPVGAVADILSADPERLQGSVGIVALDPPLTDREMTILRAWTTAQQQGEPPARGAAKAAGVSERTVSRVAAQLRARGLLQTYRRKD